MNRQECIDFTRQIAGLLRCPLCGEAGEIAGQGSFVCGRRHTFDLAAKGYLNFAPQQKQSGQRYDQALFESRRRLLAAGFYDPLTAALAEAARLLGASPTSFVVDAGCGEGSFLAALLPRLGAGRGLGLDLSRDAVQMAARLPLPCHWAVADLKHMPLKAGCVDLLLNILTPADYGEFSRVLSPGGLLLKVLPGPDYLREIRALLPEARHPRQEGRVQAHFARHMRLLDEIRVRATYDLDQEQAGDFLRMTPLTLDVRGALPRAEALRSVTVDLVVLVGKG